MYDRNLDIPTPTRNAIIINIRPGIQRLKAGHEVWTIYTDGQTDGHNNRYISSIICLHVT